MKNMARDNRSPVCAWLVHYQLSGDCAEFFAERTALCLICEMHRVPRKPGLAVRSDIVNVLTLDSDCCVAVLGRNLSSWRISKRRRAGVGGGNATFFSSASFSLWVTPERG